MAEIKVKVRGVSVFEQILGAREREVYLQEGVSLPDLVKNLDYETQGALKEALYDEKGKFKKGVRIFLNGRDSRFIPEEDLRLQSGDRVLFIPLLAGG